jgi:hypothetical protein
MGRGGGIALVSTCLHGAHKRGGGEVSTMWFNYGRLGLEGMGPNPPSLMAIV